MPLIGWDMLSAELLGGWHLPEIPPQSGSCSGTRISILVSR